MAKRKRGGGAKSTVRIGFIGVGGIAQGHVRRVLEHAGSEVACLCDPSAAMIDRTRRNYPALAETPVYSDYREMLAKEKLDAVEIMTPHTLHYEQIMSALARNLHVLTEKPLVCKVRHAEEVIRTSRRKRKVVLVSYQRHYQGEYRYMRESIARGDLGQVQMINAFQSQDWMRGTTGAWRQDPKLSGGGQLNDSGSHLLDIILWVTGLAVSQVSAFMDFFDREVDINSVLNLEFTSGAQANITICGNAPSFYEHLTIVGTKGMLVFHQGRLTHHDAGRRANYEVSGLRGAGTPESDFIAAINGGEEVQSPPVCGLRVIELTEAAWKSAAAGGRVVRVGGKKGKRKKAAK